MAEGPAPRLPHLKAGRALTAAEGTLNSSPAHTAPYKRKSSNFSSNYTQAQITHRE